MLQRPKTTWVLEKEIISALSFSLSYKEHLFLVKKLVTWLSIAQSGRSVDSRSRKVSFSLLFGSADTRFGLSSTRKILIFCGESRGGDHAGQEAGHSTRHTGRGWKSWVSSSWKRKGSAETLALFATTCWEGTDRHRFFSG